MSQAYTPALQVSPRTVVQKIRELPLPGKSLVQVGDKVKADTPVLSAELPGDLTIVRVAEKLGFEVEDVLEGMKVKVGDYVSEGDELARVQSFFGLMQSSLSAPASGTIEFFTDYNAHLGIRHAPVPLSIDAYVSGTVVEVDEGQSVTIRTEGAFMQGVFGVGGERRGRILALNVSPQEIITERHLRDLGQLTDTVIIGGAKFDSAALAYAGEQKAAAVVCGSIDAETLRSYVGYEIGVSITGDEDVPCTLIITEGFGLLPISQRIYTLAKELNGRQASVNGATQVRAGATRPEIIVSLEPNSSEEFVEEGPRLLKVGSRFRIIRVPHFGAFGTITELPHEPEEIPTGAHVRVLRAVLDSGEEVTVPRANVELT